MEGFFKLIVAIVMFDMGINAYPNAPEWAYILGYAAILAVWVARKE